MVGQGRSVNPWPIHPHTHQSHLPTQPAIHLPHPPALSPTHPWIPITPVLFLLLLHPPTHPSTHPPTHPTHPPIHPPTHPTIHQPTHPPIHSPLCPNNPTNPKHIYIMPNEFTYYSSTSFLFRIQKLMRVIWQYQNYGILDFGYPSPRSTASNLSS